MLADDESGASTSADKPYTNVRRPGGPPASSPAYRLLVHRKHEHRWTSLDAHVPVEQVQRFYDHVTQAPGAPAEGIRVAPLKGSAGHHGEGWSRVLHWRVPGSAARLDYTYRSDYIGADGDAHPVVRIVSITTASH